MKTASGIKDYKLEDIQREKQEGKHKEHYQRVLNLIGTV